MRVNEREMAALRAFLEARVFGVPLVELHNFSRGAQSFNFRVTTGEGRYLVKVGRIGYPLTLRLQKVLEALRDFPEELHVPRLLAFHGEACFEWEGHQLFVLAYARGKSRSVLGLRLRHVKRIFAHYQRLWERLQGVEGLPEHPRSNHKYATYLITQASGMQQKVQGWRQRVCAKALAFAQEVCAKAPSQSMIHGDFHNNNLLFDGDELSGVIDFNDMRVGCMGEDLARWVVCEQSRLPFFYWRGWVLRRWVRCLFAQTSVTAEEMRYGCDLEILRRICKVFARAEKRVLSRREAVHVERLLRQRGRFRRLFARDVCGKS